MRKGPGACVERMKTKNFYIVVAFILVSSATLWLLSYPPSPTFQNIVTKTQKGIKSLPGNIQQIQNNQELTVNPLYLNRLGLGKEDPLKAESSDPFVSDGEVKDVQPVIASSVGKDVWEDTVAFLESVAKHMAGYHLVMFDLGSSEDTSRMLKKYCNGTWNCEVRTFKFDMYPSHVADLSIKSYRPICIQEVLSTYGAVIWADSAEYFQSGNVTQLLGQARAVGLVAWTVEDPTSAITHPKMFDFFRTKQEMFYFHRAVETTHIVIYNSPSVREQIMLPWVKCALLEDCINPTGAQNVGCNFMRKPLFKYSGCHYYDMSALNIILGVMFEYDERPYTGKEAIFGNFVDDRWLAKNASNPLHRSRLKLRAYLNGRADEAPR